MYEVALLGELFSALETNLPLQEYQQDECESLIQLR